MPAGTPDPGWTLQTFRALAANASYLKASASTLAPWEDSLDQLRALRSSAPHAIAKSNVLPDIASLGWAQNEDAELLDYLAASRLGAFVKALGICALQGYHPFTADPGMDAVLRLAADSLHEVTTAQPNDPGLALHVSLVQAVILEEVLDDRILNDLSPADVLRLRNRAWGKAQHERAKFGIGPLWWTEDSVTQLEA